MIFALSLFLFGCSNAPFRGDQVVGADEFVIDSYKIKEGKFSILEMEGIQMAPLDPELLKAYTNTIEDGDLLKVALFHPSRLDLVESVRTIGREVGYEVTGGKITLPELAPIFVEGLTLSEAKNKIQEAYDKEIEGMEVFLSFERRDLKKIELAGLVSRATLPVNGNLRLFEVLAEAKIPPNANLFRSYLIRNGAPLPVDMYKLMKEGDMSQNIVMHGGDKLYIADPADATVLVMGEVKQEKVLDLPNGFLPLRTAIAMAGGIPYTGDRGVIQVIRGNVLRPKVYLLNWKHVMRLPMASMLLIPGDVVYVAATPITEWNRFVKQILPTLTGVELLRKGVGGVITTP